MAQAWKTIALWVLLIVLFIAFYNFFSSAPDEVQEGGRSFVRGPWFWVFILVVFVVLFVFFLKRNQKAYAINNDGITLLGQGRYIDALAKFREAEPLMKNQPLIHYNLGVVMMWLWQLNEAEAEFQKAKKKTAAGVDLKNLVMPQLALLYALRGNVTEARRELSDAGKLNLSAHASSLVAEGVLALRHGEARTAAQFLGRQEVKQLGGVSRALADACYNWAIEQATGEQRYVDRVMLFGEVGPDRLKAFWPELVAYVQTAKQV